MKGNLVIITAAASLLVACDYKHTDRSDRALTLVNKVNLREAPEKVKVVKKESCDGDVQLDNE